MKPLKGNQQLRTVSLSYSGERPAFKPKSSPRRRRGLDASPDRGLTESSGEVFSLDTLSRRMSVIGSIANNRSASISKRGWDIRVTSHVASTSRVPRHQSKLTVCYRSGCIFQTSSPCFPKRHTGLVCTSCRFPQPEQWIESSELKIEAADVTG